MRFRLIPLLFVCPLLQAPLRAQPRDLAGTYSLSIATVQGTVPGIAVIARTGSAYRGMISVFGFAPAPLTKVTVSANDIILQVDPPEGRVFVKLRVNADNSAVGTLGFLNDPRSATGTFYPGVSTTSDSSMPPRATIVLRAESSILDVPALTLTCDFTPLPSEMRIAGDYAATCRGTSNALQLDMASVRITDSTMTLDGFSEAAPARLVLTVGTTTSGTLTIGNETVRVREHVATP